MSTLAASFFTSALLNLRESNYRRGALYTVIGCLMAGSPVEIAIRGAIGTGVALASVGLSDLTDRTKWTHGCKKIATSLACTGALGVCVTGKPEVFFKSMIPMIKFALASSAGRWVWTRIGPRIENAVWELAFPRPEAHPLDHVV